MTLHLASMEHHMGICAAAAVTHDLLRITMYVTVQTLWVLLRSTQTFVLIAK